MENKFCAKCGASLEENAVFCTKCGEKVGETINNNEQSTISSTINTGTYQTISRIEIKEEAKRIYKDNMWNIWKAILVIMVITVAAGLLVSVPLIGIVVPFAIMPLSVGFFYYMINLVSGKEFEIDQLFDFYKKNVWQIILGCFLTGLFTVLWSLLFIIPGIIASISYSMVYYLYADGCEDSAMEVIKKSKMMMNGYKMDYFVFQFSFIGWFLLCGLTFGILYIWIIPYYVAANTLFLKKVKEIRG